VADSAAPARRLPRVSIRGLVFLILLVALAFGWGSARQRSERSRQLQQKRFKYALEELRRAREELYQFRPNRTRSFGEADLEGSNLSGLTIASKGNAFQRGSFRECSLEGATLSGGNASFQLAHFDGANLTRSRLTGGDASFQGSSFVGADLTGATLSGAGTSFQGVTFENAILAGATLKGDFGGANLSGARLEGADLSAITADNLASCYFKVPPSYDSRTRFPQGFDPVKNSWRRVESKPRVGSDKEQAQEENP
jgi:uncharacterized protein YjbI with pentapeptide repeats